MFRCVRGHWSALGEKMTRVASEVREKSYSDGGTGFETVHEIALCPDHAQQREREEVRRIADRIAEA